MRCLQSIDVISLKRIVPFLIIAAYYAAALLLLWAGISKLTSTGVGDILEILFEKELISLDSLFFISRWFPVLEIIVAIIAFTGIKANITAKIMGMLYIVFTLLILYVSEGYFLLPIDCGCFGETTATPVYILLLRNSVIAVFLFFFTSPYRKFTFYFFLTGKA